MDKIVVATKNKNKAMEISQILKDISIKIVSMEELGIHTDVVEDGKTFEENAYKKAYEIMKISGLPTLSDDSGLEVDELNGAPGVYSARFSGEDANDKRNNEKLLKLMKGVPDERRKARFVTVMVLIYPDGKKIVTSGEIKGIIGHEVKGNNGFGYDPLFIIPEYNLSFGELDSSIKNSISHRGRALEELKTLLEKEI